MIIRIIAVLYISDLQHLAFALLALDIVKPATLKIHVPVYVRFILPALKSGERVNSVSICPIIARPYGLNMSIAWVLSRLPLSLSSFY